MPNIDFKRILTQCQQGDPIYLYDGRRIGYLLDGQFYKVVKRSEHFLRKPPAIAIDEEVFCETIEPRCQTIVVLECEREEVWQVSVTTFSRYYLRLNRGHGTQRALCLKWWRRENGNVQLTLWGGSYEG